MLNITVETTIELMRSQWKRLLAYSLALVVVSVVLTAGGSALLMHGITVNGPGDLGQFVTQLRTALLGIALLLCLLITCINIGCAAMIRTCRVDESWSENLGEAVRQLPALSAQSGVLALPLLGSLLLVALTGSWILGLLLLLAVAPYTLVTFPPLYMLVSVECALGSRELLPRRAWQMFRAHPGTGIALGFGLMLCSLASLIPLIGPVIGVLFFALLSASSAALHAVTDSGGNDLPERDVRPAPHNVTQTSPAPHTPYPVQDQPQQQATPRGLLDYLPGTPPYAALSGTCQPGTPSGEWVGMPIDGVLVVQLSAADRSGVQLTLAAQDGRPVQLSNPYPDGSMFVQLPAGWYYLTVTGLTPQAQAWSIATYPVEFAAWNAAMAGWSDGSSEQRLPA